MLAMSMEHEDSVRYSRQTRLPQIGEAGQSKLASASVAVVGCGALGSVAAELLVRAGVGRLLLIDRDIVQWSNLQRQFLYSQRDARLGLAKVDAAARRLRQINRSIQIEPVACDLQPHNILGALRGTTLWIDGGDNFELRFLLNDAALELGTPWVHGGCVGTGGQTMVFWPGQSICFRCLVPTAPAPGTTATCDSAGVLGAATAVIASLQVAAAIRCLVEGPAAATGNLLAMDVWEMQPRIINTRSLAALDCPACKQGRRDFLNADTTGTAAALCGQNAVQIPATDEKIDLRQIADRWRGLATVQETRFFVRISEAETRLTVFQDGRVIVEGTADLGRARALRSQFLGG